MLFFPHCPLLLQYGLSTIKKYKKKNLLFYDFSTNLHINKSTKLVDTLPSVAVIHIIDYYFFLFCSLLFLFLFTNHKSICISISGQQAAVKHNAQLQSKNFLSDYCYLVIYAASNACKSHTWLNLIKWVSCLLHVHDTYLLHCHLLFTVSCLLMGAIHKVETSWQQLSM